MGQGLARFVMLLVIFGKAWLWLPYVVLHVLVHASREKHLDHWHLTVLSTDTQGRGSILLGEGRA